MHVGAEVASYFDSTSNHNDDLEQVLEMTVASYFDSTSNHNNIVINHQKSNVASYFDSTSNHNILPFAFFISKLLHILILHQTTTKHHSLYQWNLLLHILILHQTTTVKH